MKRWEVLNLAGEEMERAEKAHPAMSSPHEGYAVIREELDELWDEIKADRGTTHKGLTEAIQVAAMALRYVQDLCDTPTAQQHTRKAETYYDSGFVGGYSG